MERVEALGKAVGVAKSCRVLGVPRSRLYRYRAGQEKLQKPLSKPRFHPRSLSREEKSQVRQTLNSERFQDQAPREIYATLLDEGQYLCHWRTMYRILDDYAEVRERRNQLTHPQYRKPELLARGPNQVWSWDTPALAVQVQVSLNCWGRSNGRTITCT